MQALAIAAPLMQGIAGYTAAQGEKKQAEINAYIGRTRAMQTDTVARQNLNDELGTMRATFASNGQKMGVGAMEMFKALREARGQERRIAYGNRMAEAADWKMTAKNAQNKATGALLTGVAKAGPSLFEMFQ